MSEDNNNNLNINNYNIIILSIIYLLFLLILYLILYKIKNKKKKYRLINFKGGSPKEFLQKLLENIKKLFPFKPMIPDDYEFLISSGFPKKTISDISLPTSYDIHIDLNSIKNEKIKVVFDHNNDVYIIFRIKDVKKIPDNNFYLSYKLEAIEMMNLNKLDKTYSDLENWLNNNIIFIIKISYNEMNYDEEINTEFDDSFSIF